MTRHGMRFVQSASAATLLCALIVLPACRHAAPADDADPSKRTQVTDPTPDPTPAPPRGLLSPGDFLARPGETLPPPPARQTVFITGVDQAPGDAVPAATDSTAATPATSSAALNAPAGMVVDTDDLIVQPYQPAAPPPKYVMSKDAYAVEAMIGQVNGRAIYAWQVFKDLDAQLAGIGQRLPRAAFRQQASELIELRLRQIVMDSLILGEAESTLTEQQRFGLIRFLQLQREELVRLWGLGSEALTEQRLREQQGIGLEQKVEETRQRVIVQNYMRQKLFPKINVTRKDIERHYASHADKFNPPPGRTIHMIRTSRKDRADEIDRRLNEGVAFAEVAGDRSLNEYKPEEQGLFGKGIKGEGPFGPAALNQAMAPLKEGEYSPRVVLKASSGEQYYWIYVPVLSTGQGKALREVQLEIEQELRRQQYQRLSDQYQKKLLADGSYNPIEEMRAMLLQVALSIYASKS